MKLVAPLLGGSGGGKDDLAFGGVKDLSNFNKAKEALLNEIKK